MSARGFGSKVYSLLMFLAVSILTGVLVAGLGIPVTALVAGLTKTGAASLKQLPADLAVPPQPESSKMLLSDGSVLATFFDENRQYVKLDQIAKVMQDAQVAIEDHRFFEHGALDLKSVVRAAFGNAAEGTVSGGGSTLTQQYIKLVRVQICGEDAQCIKDMTAPKLDRKIVEMRYAVALEQKLSKQDILERYLNIAYYGDGAYGVQAAARHYFGIDAKDLNLAQASLLAGLVQNPGTTDPVNHPDTALARRRDVLAAMVNYQNLDPQEASKAAQTPFDKTKVVVTGGGCEGTRYPFICDYARRVLISDQMKSLGDTDKDREQMLQRAGLTVTLTIDPRIQDAAQKAVSSIVGPQDAAIGVATTVDPHTGRVLAMAQSRPEMGTGPGQTYLNYAVSHEYGDYDGFLMGSTFKAWTAAAAIQQGKFPDVTYYNVPKTETWNGHTFEDCDGNIQRINDVKPWTTTNAVLGEDSGQFNMTTGMMWSVNNYWVNLILDTSPCASVDMAKRAGVELAWPQADANGFGDDLMDYQMVPSFVLGAPKVTVLSMATGYGTFANRGIRCLPIILGNIKSKDGTEVPVPSADCQQTIDPKVADGVNYVMNQTMVRGLGAPYYIPNGIDQGSKTGTGDNSQSALAYVGYTPDLSTSVVIAGDNTRPEWKNTPEQQRNVANIFMTPLGRPLGMTNGGSIWKPLMAEAMKGMPKSHFVKFVQPAGAVTTYNGKTAPPPPPPTRQKPPTSKPPSQAPSPQESPTDQPPPNQPPPPPATKPPATKPPANQPQPNQPQRATVGGR